MAPYTFRLCELSYSEFNSSLPLPKLPFSFGADSEKLKLVDVHRSSNSLSENVAKISELLRATDISYLNLKVDKKNAPTTYPSSPSSLVNKVHQYAPDALKFSEPGTKAHEGCSSVLDNCMEKQTKQCNGNAFTTNATRVFKENKSPGSAVKSNCKKRCEKKHLKGVHNTSDCTSMDDDMGLENTSRVLKDFVDRNKFSHEIFAEDGSSQMPFCSFKILSDELLAVSSKKALNLLPVHSVIELLDLLNQFVSSVGDTKVNDSDYEEAKHMRIMSALEAVQLCFTIMTHPNMPKKVYKEEVIDNLIEFTRKQIIHSVLPAVDSSHHITDAASRTTKMDGTELCKFQRDDTAGKKISSKSKMWNFRRASSSMVSSVISGLLSKLCSIVALLKDLVLIERLHDRMVRELIKTNMSIFSVENMQLLQLKSSIVICAVYSSYAEHRLFIRDEIIRLVLRMTSSRHSGKTYFLPDDDQKEILIVTALVLDLVQSSVRIPETVRVGDKPNASNCLGPAMDFCGHFWESLLHCLGRSRSCDTSEIKLIVENLVMDLLTVLDIPEFPAANVMLQVLCFILLGENGLKSKDIVLRGIAVDVLGQIAARLKRDSLLLKDCSQWILQELNNKAFGVEPEYEQCVICTGEKGEKLMLVCEVCHRFFHADCVTICGDGSVRRTWVCFCCICRKQLTSLETQFCRDNKSDKHSTTGSLVTGNTVLQQILLNYLQDISANDASIVHACQFYLCLWFKDDSCPVKLLPFYHGRLNIQSHFMDSGIVFGSLSRNIMLKIASALQQQRSLARGFDKLLERLLTCFRENSSTLRAKALKAVSAIVEVDPELLCDMHVKHAVEERFLDSAISVREAAIELVGRHMVFHPNMVVQYIHNIAGWINDKGVSVRKRAIKIIRELCNSKTNAQTSTELCSYIFQRVYDEEQCIQDLVCKTFYGLWFEEPTNEVARVMGDKSFVPLEVAEKTQQIIEVLSVLRNYKPLVCIVKRTLDLEFCSKSNGVNQVLQATIRNRCELMCRWLLESILKVEETNNIECETDALPFVLALNAFCTVDPTLCAPAFDPSCFVLTLEPYLRTQADNRCASQLLQSIVDIITSVLPLLRRPLPNFVEDLEQDLSQLILCCKFLPVVDACIRCLCSLCRVSTKVIIKFECLLRRFIKHLDKDDSVEDVDDNKLHALRCLFSLGLFVRYGVDHFKNLSGKPLSIEELIVLCARYYDAEDNSFKGRALQALGFLCIAKPESMIHTEIRRITASSLCSDADQHVKLQALRNFYDYLIDIEGKSRSQSIQSERETKHAIPVKSGESDNNICVGALHLHWQSILENCLNGNDKVRLSVLQIMEIVLRQGLVHPVTCVPYLIASVVDEVEANSKLAYSLLIQMNEKYPTYFESRIGDGVELSFKFFHSCMLNPLDVKTSSTKSSEFFGRVALSVKSGISRLYKLFQRNSASRNKFLSTIIHKFDPSNLQKSSLDFLFYCTELLAALPFTSADEPAYLLQIINHILQPRAGNIEASLKKLIEEIQRDPVNMNNMNIKTCGSQTQRNHPARELEQNIPHPYQQELKEECHAAIVYASLLRLKRYIKLVYSLTDTFSQTFSANDVAKSSETPIKKNIVFSTVDIPSDYTLKSVTDVIQLHEILKMSLEEDSMDYTYSPYSTRKRSRALCSLASATSSRKLSQRFCSLASPAARGQLQVSDAIPGKQFVGRRLFFSDCNEQESRTKQLCIDSSSSKRMKSDTKAS